MKSQNLEIPLSPSVGKLLDNFQNQKAVTAFDIFHFFQSIHPEYAKGLIKTINLVPSKMARRAPASEWINRVRDLLDPDNCRELHGRLLIIGLTLTDKPFGVRYKESFGLQLTQNDFLQTLVNEINEDLPALLIPPVRKRWEGFYRQIISTPQGSTEDTEIKMGEKTEKESPEQTAIDKGGTVKTATDLGPIPPDIGDSKTHTDLPIQSKEDDLLGRDALAKSIAQLLRNVKAENDGAFIMHIDGPWGSGKSSLLNLIKNHFEEDKTAYLKKEKPAMTEEGKPDKKEQKKRQMKKHSHLPWIVVLFNAWQHQRIQPPWWSLMSKIYKTIVNRLWKKRKILPAIRLFFHELLWRLNPGTNMILTPLIFAGILGLMVYLGLTNILEIEKYTKIITGFVISITAIWGLAKTLSGSMLSGSAKGAKVFKEVRKDPMHALSKHFTETVRFAKQPVVIFIDDLDRCSVDYGVELMEGIQTLFKNAPVFILIAADGRWLNLMYEKNYEEFEGLEKDSGKPLGLLFMEKTFQLTLPIPKIPEEIKKNYWQHLFDLDREERKKALSEAETKASQIVTKGMARGEMLRVATQTEGDPLLQQKIREHTVVLLASDLETEKTKDALKDFADFLEPNPRAMKRLKNAVTIELTINILGYTDFDYKALILWTILKMRFPGFAQYLLEEADNLDGETLFIEDEAMKKLYVEREVQDILDGNGVEASISVDFLKKLAS